MRNSKLTRVIALLLGIMMMSCLGLSVCAVSLPTGTSAASVEDSTTAEALEILGDDKWTEYKEKYGSYPNYEGEPIVIRAVDAETSSLPEGAQVMGELGGKSNVLYLPDSGTVTWKVTVPVSGLYAIDLSYFPIQSKATDIERTLRINGEVPFTEVRNLLMTKRWEEDLSELTVVRDENGNITDIEYEKDSSGNERRPSKVENPMWMEYTVCDPTGNYNNEFYFYLEAGENTISLEAQKEPVVLDTITLRTREETLTYEEYQAKNAAAGYTKAPADSSIFLEAEFYTATSSSTIYGQNDRSSAVTSPQSAKYQLINDVGGKNGSYNWSTVGQWIEWTFVIPEGKAGLYTINTRFLQDQVEGLFVSRRLYLDGEIPFEEANNLEFLYSGSWQVGTFSDGTTEFEFYLSEGEHTMKLEVNLGNLGEIISEIRDCVTQINSIYIKILQISGSSPDPYMDYSYYKRIPDEISEMGVIAKRLFDISEKMQQISGGKKSSSTATIENVARILQKMSADSERQIAKNFTQLKSYIGNLGTWLNEISQQSLILDYFVIQPAGNELPAGEGNFFRSAWYEIQMFFYSFVNDESSFESTAEGENVVKLEVWTTVSREYTQIIRSLIDESFSRDNPNISVNLKLVTAGTLLPATLSGVGPDVMMDVTSSDAINYAVRGATLDVSQYEGFDEVYGYFHESAWVPLTVALGSSDGDIAVYGVPEKQSFNVMFYRKDVFAELGLKIPTTWDEFNAVLPILVSKNYLIGAGASADRTNLFYMMIYQNGGELYSNNGTTISFDQDVTLDAFTRMCSFYTTYKLPLTYDAPNRFRTGEMPLFFGDYITNYNQFTVFAPELKGLWGFTSIPGTVQEDGTVNSSIVSSVNCIVIMKDAVDRGTGQAGFDFIKWWMSAGIQGQYANELVALLGSAGKYATANMEAFNDMSWSSNELRELRTQFSNLVGVPEMPGSYIISRYVGFAFLNVYNDGMVPSEALMDYTATINKEFERKREELKREFYIPSKK